MVKIIRSGSLPQHRSTREQDFALLARPWERSGSVDVEQLAIWAYRDQKVDRFATVGLHAIEITASGMEAGGRSSDGCAAIADINHMGCRIDYSGRIVKDSVHRAAEIVAALLAEIDHGRMVAFHARLGGRPDGWERPSHWYRATVWVKPWQDAQVERTGRGTSPTFCSVIPTVTREELARRRLAYLNWWGALDALAWRLSMQSLGFTVRPPSAPQAPWETESEGDA